MVILPLLGALVIGLLSGREGYAAAPLLAVLLVKIVGVGQAIPLITLALLVANLPLLAGGWRTIEGREVARSLLVAVPAAAMGALIFTQLGNEWRLLLLGVVLVVLAATSLAGFSHWLAARSPASAIQAVAGLVSGLGGSSGPLATSVAGSVVTPPAPAAASLAVVALVVHGAKWAVFQTIIPPEPTFIGLAAAMGAALFLGHLVGRRLPIRLDALLQQVVLPGLLLISAVMLLIWFARQ